MNQGYLIFTQKTKNFFPHLRIRERKQGSFNTFLAWLQKNLFYGDDMQHAIGTVAVIPGIEPVPHAEPVPPDVLSLQLWKNGNMRGYNQIVERYQKPLFHFIYRIVRDMDESKDILQETFVRMYKYKERFDEEKSLKSWLYQTANNLCIDFFRKHKPGRVNFYDQQDSLFSTLVESSGLEREKQPDEIAQDNRLYEIILKAIEQLPKKQKMVMTLRSCKNLSLKEIAEVMGCTQQTVGTTLFAARKKLIQLLSPVLEELYGCSAEELL